MDEFFSELPFTPRQQMAQLRLLRDLFAPLPADYQAMKLQRAGVTAEGLRPYRRFLTIFFDTALTTYLGGTGGVRYNGTDRSAHFDWCLRRATELTVGDLCRYSENEELVDYLREYLYLALYAAVERPSQRELDSLLDPNHVEGRAELADFLDLWKIFEATPRRGRRIKPRAAQTLA